MTSTIALYLDEPMQHAARFRVASMVLAGALMVTTASGDALFRAEVPGGDLAPIGDAGALIDLIQGPDTVLWSSLAGPVRALTVLGWPEEDGSHTLGGGLYLERPANGLAGVIDIGEKPMAAEFSLDG